MAVAALVALTGCSVEGTLDVTPDAIGVDLEISHRAPQRAGDGSYFGAEYCGVAPGGTAGVQLPGLTREMREAPPGTLACRLHGVLRRAERPTTFDGFVVVANGFVFASLPGIGDDDLDPDPLERIDLTVTFPGEIVATTAQAAATGSTLRLTRPDQVTTALVQVTARDGRFGLRDLLGPLGLLAAAGVGGTATWLALRRRPAARPADPPAQPPPDSPARPTGGSVRDAPSEGGRPPPEDPGVWAPGPGA